MLAFLTFIFGLLTPAGAAPPFNITAMDAFFAALAALLSGIFA